jgi:chemotaxis protein MotA
MFLIIGASIVVGSILGGYVALGGYLIVLWQPFELAMIGGSGVGAFVIVKFAGQTRFEAIRSSGTEAVIEGCPRRIRPVKCRRTTRRRPILVCEERNGNRR